MPGIMRVAISTPRARTSQRTRRRANGEFIGLATFPRSGVRAMKITLLQDHLRSGGTERHSIFLAKEFNALGHRARLVTFRPGGALSGFGGAEHHTLQPFDTGIDWFGPGLTRAVLDDGPDIVLCMGKTANCFAGRLQRRARARRLTTRVIASLRAGGKLPDLYYTSTRQASHLVTNSQEAAD